MVFQQHEIPQPLWYSSSPTLDQSDAVNPPCICLVRFYVSVGCQNPLDSEVKLIEHGGNIGPSPTDWSLREGLDICLRWRHASILFRHASLGR